MKKFLERLGRAPIEDRIVAVFDGDRVRELYGLESSATHEEIERAIRRHARLEVHLVVFDRNVETLLKVAAEILGEQRPSKKTPVLRDELLGRLRVDRRRRAQAEERFPGLEALVTRLFELLALPQRS